MSSQAEMVRTLHRLFPQVDEVAELRLLHFSPNGNRRGAKSHFFATDDDGLAEMARAARLADADGGFNVYVGLNPRTPTLLGGDEAAATHHITHRRWLFVDVDPTRAEGHKTDASTDEEKKVAKGVMKEVVAYLYGECGWPAPGLLADSANGLHALWCVALPPDDDELCHKCLLALAAKFDCAGATIDPKMGDAPRITRCYGTTNRKGVESPARPHRVSVLLPQQVGVPQVVSREKLEALATSSRITDVKEKAPQTDVIWQRIFDIAGHSGGKSKQKRKEDTKESQREGTEEGLDRVELAREWLAGVDSAVWGDNGSDRTFNAAAGLVVDFGLSVEEARPLLAEYSARCDPPWSEKELEHKLESVAAKAEKLLAEGKPEEVGWRWRKAQKEVQKEEQGGRVSDFNTLVSIAEQSVEEVWTTTLGGAFATVEKPNTNLLSNPDSKSGTSGGTHTENHPIESRGFKGWLHQKFREINGRSPKYQDLETAAKALAYTAQENGAQYEVYSRVGWEGCGTIWVDLCDKDWSAVRITAEGWTVEPKAAVKFRRGNLLAPLPTPQRVGAGGRSPGLRGQVGGWDLLRPLVNVSDDDWPLVPGFLTACFLPPPAIFPLLYLHGVSGAGKNVLSLQLLSFVDPRTMPIRGAIPPEEETVLLSAQKTLLQVFTNLSQVSTKQSDMLCRLAEGTSWERRTLYDDDGLSVFAARRPCLLNGINPVADRGDFLSRAILISLSKAEKSHTDDEIMADTNAVRPLVLGALYDSVATALRHYRGTVVKDPPRMHSLARWVIAAEPSFSGGEYKLGDFRKAYDRSLHAGQGVAMEASPLPPLIKKVVANKGGSFRGNATEWLAELCAVADAQHPGLRHNKSWPQGATACGQKIAELVPDLAAVGLVAVRGKGQSRSWEIALMKSAPTPPQNTEDAKGESSGVATPPT